MAKKQGGGNEKKKFATGDSVPAPAEVVEILGKVGTKQGGTQVRCKILDGPEKEKIMRRNVYGPICVGDVLILRETEIEASPIKGRKG